MGEIIKSFIAIFALGVSAISSCGATLSPDYTPFLYPGKEWIWTYIRISEESGRTESVARQTVGEKTIVDGEECYIVHVTSDVDCFEPYDIYMKETEGIVSRSLGEGRGFYNLYNFNVHKGDILAFGELSGNPESYIVSDIREVKVNGTNRKFIKLCSQENDHYVTWVEGIGDYYGNGMINFDIPIESSYGFFGHFIECHENGECVFTENDFKKSPWDSSQAGFPSLLTDTPVP